MRKVIKILGMVVSAIVLLLIFLPVTATLLLSVDSVQNYIVKHATTFASDYLDCHVSIGRIDIDLLSKVHVYDFYVEDHEQDTLLFVDEAEARIASLNIKRDGLRLTDVEAEGVEFKLREMANGELNVRPIVQRLTNPNKQSEFRLYIDEAEISQSRFRYERLVHRNPVYGVDYGNMEIGHIKGKLSNFAVVRGVVSSNVNKMYAVERSGFELKNFTGFFEVDHGDITFENIVATTDSSKAHIPKLVLDGENWLEYKNYIDLVEMRGQVINSYLSTHDLGFFAPGVRNWELVLRNISGSFTGVVRDFEATLESVTIAENTTLKGDAHIIGLPDWRESEYIVSVDNLHTTAPDVELLIRNVTKRELHPKVYSIMRNLRTADIRGTFGGELYSFHTMGNITTPQGNVSADVELHRAGGGMHSITGSATTDNLHIGRILTINKLGTTDAHITINGDIGSGGVVADLSAKVSDIGIDRHRFRDISARGSINGKKYDAWIVSEDKNLAFDLTGIIDMERPIPSYELMLNLRNADLNKMGINKRDSISLLALQMGVDIDGSTIDDIDGTISISDARYTYPNGELQSNRLSAEIRGDDRKDITIKSDFADIEFQSRANYKEIATYLTNALKRYIPLLYNSDAKSTAQPSDDKASSAIDYSVLMVHTHEKLNDLLDAIMSGMLIAPDTELSLVFSPTDNHFALQLGSEALEYKGVILADANVDVKNDRDSLLMWLNSEAIYLGSRRLLPNFNITGTAHQNHINLSAAFKDEANRQSGLLAMGAKFSRNPETRHRSVNIDISPSHFTSKTHQWNLYAGGIDIDSSRINVRSLHIARPEQQLIIDGVASRDRRDSIRLQLDNFDLSPLSALISRWGYEFKANSYGYATVRSALHNPQIDARIDLTDIAVNGIEAPPQLLTSNWDFERNRARVIISDGITRDTVIRGYYQPQGNRYFAEANLSGVEMSIIQPFLKGIISDIHGTASAKANIRGEGRIATLNGSAEVDSIDVHVDYTNTRYRAPKGKLTIKDNHILADKIPVFDEEGNKGHYSMDINLEHLSNVTYDIGVEAKDMLVFDTDAKHSDLFYGHVYASGTASFKGDKRGTKMDIEGTSSPNSKFFMPLSGKEDVSYADFVRFKKPEVEGVDTSRFLTRRMMAYERKNRPVNTSGGMMDMDITLNVLPNVEVQLVIDPTVGDIIKGKGTGQLSMHVVPKANIFDMSGDFTITEGTYLFTLQNVINKLFTVEPGSTIQWTGDPLGAELNIDAIYSTKASLKPLLGNSTQGVDISRAVPVDCYIKLTGPLMSPEVNFDVEVTNVAPEIQTIVQSALNDQQAIATQMFWLLAANTFSAEDSGSMGASLSATTGFELLSNQLSNWLSGDNYNIVLRYRPRTELTGDEVDFGFSKSWFNNRLIVEVEGGYLSDAAKQASQNASNFVAEGFIAWLIDPDGVFRLKGFTQTIDRYGENQGMQEGGVGLYYGESFNTFKELGRSIRSRFVNAERRDERRKRREAKRDSLEALKHNEQDTIYDQDSLNGKRRSKSAKQKSNK